MTDDQLHIISVSEPEKWREWLANTGRYDFYDLPEYHALAQERGEGEALLLAFEQEDTGILLPLLLRPLNLVDGLEQVGAGLFDATSVYGYSGPLLSDEAPSASLAAAFQFALGQWTRSRGIVSIFSRLHPLRSGGEVLSGLGEIRVHGPTVSIDLTLSDEEQWRRYRSNHRRNISKLRSLGYDCRASCDDEALSAFSNIYRETMERREAGQSYFFDDAYFRALRDMGCFTFILCEQHGSLAAGALVSSCNGIAQYHLGGTAAAHLGAAPMKLVFDDARRWAAGQGCSVLHLGGGLGAQCDSLFNFKAGFSDRRHEFRTWRWTADEGRSAALLEARAAWASRDGRILGPDDAFPAYRRAGSSIR